MGRRTLEPGTYAVTARPAGRPRQTRPVVVIVGSGSLERLNCGSAAGPEFLSTAPFGDDSSNGSVGSATTESIGASKAKNQDQKSRGVLPAITKKIRELPSAIAPPVPRPGFPPDAGSPPAFLGVAALVLLALSGLAIVAYVIRFLRGPDTKSA